MPPVGARVLILRIKSKAKEKANTLEAKVDGILSLLQSVGETTKRGDMNTLPFRTPGNDVFEGQQTSTLQDTVQRQTVANGRQNIVESTPLDSTPSLTGSKSSIVVTPAPLDFSCNAAYFLNSESYSSFGPSTEERADHLTEFRTQRLINFAFIHLPTGITPQRLQQERPFLFLTIIAVSSKSSSQRLGLGRKIKQILAREVFADHEGNFDVLLGLLVFTTWFAIHHIHIE
jgi:hypothetical protein